jgi:hypothetical protein
VKSLLVEPLQEVASEPRQASGTDPLFAGRTKFRRYRRNGVQSKTLWDSCRELIWINATDASTSHGEPPGRTR